MPSHKRPASSNQNTTGISPKQKQSRKNDPQLSTTSGACTDVSSRYEKVGRVGEGTYGIVYKAKDRVTNNYVALKRCIPHHESSDGFPVTTLREIQSLKICASHPHIVHLETIAVSKHGVFLVFEYCEHDLADLIDAHYQQYRKSPFSEAAVKTLLQQLLSALDFMHSRHLIHRDLKVSNLLYTNAGSLKLADFGLSRPYAKDLLMTCKVASLWYRPPELLLDIDDSRKHYTPAIDLWAAGCIFGEIIKGFPIMNGKTELDQAHLLFQCLGVPTAAEWPDFGNLALIRNGSVRPSASHRRQLLDTFGDLSPAGLKLFTSLLRFDPAQRWTAAQALESAYFVEAPLPKLPSDMPQFPSSHKS